MSSAKTAPSANEVRVRFAPSPTGYLHVGGARTALYNFLFARQHQGKFVLRIEDTDEARSTEESLKMVIEDLQWLGLTWDEGPDPKTLKDIGDYGPYRQSQRLDLYKKYADELLASGKAYHCFLSDAEIDTQREKLMKEGKPPHVESPYADWPLAKAEAEIKAGKQGVVRFKTRHLRKDYVFTDLVRGEVKFPSDMVGDFVLLRTGGMPVYNFCNVVDDHLMKITHVLRAEEHLPNTLRQLMIYEAMSWPEPQFGHLSLILDEDRKKLSKRKGATSCHEFKMEGYLPEALNNFVALLGWSHPDSKEVMPLSEMIEKFGTDRLHPAGAVFDAVKLKWMNSVHLRERSNKDIFELLKPFLDQAGLELPSDPAWQEKSVGVFRSAMETLVEAAELYRPLSDKAFVVQPESEEALKWETSKAVIQAWRDLVSAHPRDEFTEEEFSKIQDQVKEKSGAKGKNLFMPVRVAVIGKPHGTDLKLLVPLMKKSSLVKRADEVLAQL
ncbi:MAG: glutamate--tRNA ligase [Bdellovibrio sp.]